MADWEDIVQRELGRYHDGEARLPAEPTRASGS
jgi:hypothetical protein